MWLQWFYSDSGSRDVPCKYKAGHFTHAVFILKVQTGSILCRLVAGPAAPSSSENLREDGGATSRGAIGVWENPPQHTENYQDAQGRSIDGRCINHPGQSAFITKV